jgi:hypothetical protein
LADCGTVKILLLNPREPYGRQITKAAIAAFKQTIMKWLPNMNAMPEHRVKTISEFIRYVETHQKRRLPPVAGIEINWSLHFA